MTGQSGKTEFSGLIKKAEKALRVAVRDAIKDHVRTGDPMYFWKDGRVIKVAASKLLKSAT